MLIVVLVSPATRCSTHSSALASPATYCSTQFLVQLRRSSQTCVFTLCGLLQVPAIPETCLVCDIAQLLSGLSGGVRRPEPTSVPSPRPPRWEPCCEDRPKMDARSLRARASSLGVSGISALSARHDEADLSRASSVLQYHTSRQGSKDVDRKERRERWNRASFRRLLLAPNSLSEAPCATFPLRSPPVCGSS